MTTQDTNRKQVECSRCARRAPMTETNYTLIGSKHAWRMLRRNNPDGTFAIIWFCPPCWSVVKLEQFGSDARIPAVKSAK